MSMNFENSSYFIVPVCVSDSCRLRSELEQNREWLPVPQEELNTTYLLHYSAQVFTRNDFSYAFRYAKPESLPICMFDDYLKLDECPKVKEIRLIVFATGIAFLEYLVTYGSLPVSQIIDFAYNFKKADRADRLSKKAHRPLILKGRMSVYTASQRILPSTSGMTLFFANSDPLRYQSLCFHMIYQSDPEINGETLAGNMFCLSRSYDSNFLFDPKRDPGEYDMSYSPYRYIHWAGSQEGIVTVCCKTGVGRTDYFLENYHYDHLLKDYHHMYLLLLHQRFSAIRYIREVSDAKQEADVKRMNDRVLSLKTRFSFRVVSDDLVYQNVYSRMYRILEIEPLLADLEDIGGRLQEVHNAQNERRNQIFSVALSILSVLSVFSALVDASAYFDRFSLNPMFATVLSLCIVLVAGVIAPLLVWLLLRRKP